MFQFVFDGVLFRLRQNAPTWDELFEFPP